GGPLSDGKQTRYQAGQKQSCNGQAAGDPQRRCPGRDGELRPAPPAELEGLAGHGNLGDALKTRKRLVGRAVGSVKQLLVTDTASFEEMQPQRLAHRAEDAIEK